MNMLSLSLTLFLWFSLVPLAQKIHTSLYIVTQICGYGLVFTSYTGEDVGLIFPQSCIIQLSACLQISKLTNQPNTNKFCQIFCQIAAVPSDIIKWWRLTHKQNNRKEGIEKINQGKIGQDRWMVSKDFLCSRMHRRVLIDVYWLEPAVKRQHVEMVWNGEPEKEIQGLFFVS